MCMPSGPKDDKDMRAAGPPAELRPFWWHTGKYCKKTERSGDEERDEQRKHEGYAIERG